MFQAFISIKTKTDGKYVNKFGVVMKNSDCLNFSHKFNKKKKKYTKYLYMY